MNYNSIGKLVASFGVQGELILQHHLGKKTSLKGLQAIFIERVKGELLPYFITSTKIKSEEEIYLKLEGINSKEAAGQLRQKEVWLKEEDFQKYSAKSAIISLLGFRLIDEGTDRGAILEIIEQPHQMLARIDLDGKEALIPLHEQSLQKIDKKKKEVHVILPEGLLDVYR
ncbi:MAG TPA: ribosome maturation factor RimM [Chitinophagaceae bacterium]|nr:ribosome maturation factor RimM [Chitinophagaceae bacterium]